MLAQEYQRNHSNKLIQIRLSDSTDDENSVDEFHNAKKNPKINKTKYKTQMCKNFSEMGFCQYKNKCQFAHGEHELCRLEPPAKKFYRTRRCHSFWTFGVCSYGKRCQFSHYQIPEDSTIFLQICKYAFTEEQGKSKLLNIIKIVNNFK